VGWVARGGEEELLLLVVQEVGISLVIHLLLGILVHQEVQDLQQLIVQEWQVVD